MYYYYLFLYCNFNNFFRFKAMWRSFIADTESVKQPPMQDFEHKSSDENNSKQESSGETHNMKNKNKKKSNKTEKKIRRKTPIIGKKARKINKN